MELANKIIVITGAGSGIGRALAIRFKAEGAKQIVAVDINAENAQATAAMIDGVAMTADVSVEDDIVRVIETTEAQIGPIDLFCSNAGVGIGPDLNSPNSQWQTSWDVNLMSHLYAARHLVPRMVGSRWRLLFKYSLGGRLVKPSGCRGLWGDQARGYRLW